MRVFSGGTGGGLKPNYMLIYGRLEPTQAEPLCCGPFSVPLLCKKVLLWHGIQARQKHSLTAGWAGSKGRGAAGHLIWEEFLQHSPYYPALMVGLEPSWEGAARGQGTTWALLLLYCGTVQHCYYAHSYKWWDTHTLAFINPVLTLFCRVYVK